ncbi:serine/threonine-protein phosphatase [Plakobranchus ocellatus]|uniref:Serine/threonine-protein phosphatase n=1 Tax=Plakobranchus ocellatus TaxID=259542 RepID=A0AAV3YHU2_9GAST|nr:serine/threonine-protein phosphatase [Plakobranchus ocellatus]
MDRKARDISSQADMLRTMSKYRFLRKSNIDCYLLGRKVPDVPFPLQNTLTVDDVFAKDGVPDLERLANHFQGEGRVDMTCLTRILRSATSIMSRENNVVHVTGSTKGKEF